VTVLGQKPSERERGLKSALVPRLGLVPSWTVMTRDRRSAMPRKSLVMWRKARWWWEDDALVAICGYRVSGKRKIIVLCVTVVCCETVEIWKHM